MGVLAREVHKSSISDSYMESRVHNNIMLVIMLKLVIFMSTNNQTSIYGQTDNHSTLLYTCVYGVMMC